MIKLDELKLSDILPERLKTEEILALTNALDGELQAITKAIDEVVIMPRIREQPEDIVDSLAWQLHVDFYEPLGLDLDRKRALVENSIIWHKHKGTKYALESIIRILFFNDFAIEEWFEYDGEPYYFRIVANDRLPDALQWHDLLRAIHEFKNERSWLDAIIYQSSTTIEISVEGTVFRTYIGTTGTYRAGTLPHRNTVGRVEHVDIEIDTDSTGYRSRSTPSGTNPRRARTALLYDNVIETHNDSMGFPHRFGMTDEYHAGERPGRNTIGSVKRSDIDIASEGAAHKHTSPPAGTKPGHNTKFAEDNRDISTGAKAEAFTFPVDMAGAHNAGEEPRHNMGFAHDNGSIDTETAATGSPFTPGKTGTNSAGEEPRRNIALAHDSLNISADSMGEPFTFAPDMAGSKKAGEEPHRNTTYNHDDQDVSALTQTEAFLFVADMAGERKSGEIPHENIAGGIARVGADVNADGSAHHYQSREAGTAPHHNKTFAEDEGGITTEIAGDNFSFVPNMTGVHKSGEEPVRNTAYNTTEQSIQANVSTESAAYPHDKTGAHGAGQQPKRNIAFVNENLDVSTGLLAEDAIFEPNLTGRYEIGTEPRVGTERGLLHDGIVPVVETDSFGFTTKRCGTSRTENNNS